LAQRTDFTSTDRREILAEIKFEKRSMKLAIPSRAGENEGAIERAHDPLSSFLKTVELKTQKEGRLPSERTLAAAKTKVPRWFY